MHTLVFFVLLSSLALCGDEHLYTCGYDIVCMYVYIQVLIVADAYKWTSWTDWINPLYKVIIGGHFQYLGDFKTAFPLKPNMIQELASTIYVHMYVHVFIRAISSKVAST